jgi:putative glutamine amidotransferase
MEIYLARRALRDGLPVLGICRGAQVLNISAGGTLYQDLRGVAALQHNQRAPRAYSIHNVFVRRPSLLYRLVGQERIRVNSFHHQAIRHAGEGLRVSAEAADGVIEAVESAGHPFALGVQWHPEWQTAERGEAVKIFTALKEAAEKRRKRRHGKEY